MNDTYSDAVSKGYNAFWNADTKGCPYLNDVLRDAWFIGYWQAEHDIATGNY